MSSNLESSKTLAGIGAILLLLGFVPAAGIIIGIIGVILLLMGIKGLAVHYQDDEIYHNTVIGVMFYIIALIVAGVGIVGLAFGGVFPNASPSHCQTVAPAELVTTLGVFKCCCPMVS